MGKGGGAQVYEPVRVRDGEREIQGVSFQLLLLQIQPEPQVASLPSFPRVDLL